MSQEPSYCGNCGAYLPSGEIFCTACGQKRVIPLLISSHTGINFNLPPYGNSINSTYPYTQPVNNQYLPNQPPYKQWNYPNYNPYGQSYNNQSINPFIGILIFISTFIFPLIPIFSMVMFFYYWRKNMLRASKQVFNITLVAILAYIIFSINVQMYFTQLLHSGFLP